MSPVAYEFVCQNPQCGKTAVKTVWPSRKQLPRFCCVSCLNAWQRGRSVQERFEAKLGAVEGAERTRRFKLTMSKATSGEKNPMHGRHDHVHGLQRVTQHRTGKTNAEIYGEERAADISRRTSAAVSGENNPAWGKVYARSGRSVKGWYKGVFFRSLFELSFLLHAERSMGLDVQHDLDYEAHLIRWSGGTYRPDFGVPSQGLLFEVKPSRLAKTPKNMAKFEAARAYCAERGLEFRVVTEDDFPKLSFQELLAVEGVKWDERTFEYFRKP